jgi:thiamine biosynthesis lipoprotein
MIRMWLILMDSKQLFSIIFLGLFFSCQQDDHFVTKRIEGYALGTTYSISFNAENLEETFVEHKVDSLFTVLNQSLSTYIPTSDISKINRGDSLLVVDDHFVTVYKQATEIWNTTEGFFDPTVGALVNAYGFGPGKKLNTLSTQQLDSILQFTGWDKTKLNTNNTILKTHPKLYFDFNALAKGYAVDVLANYLRHLKVTSFLVEIGGEIVAQGKSLKSNSFWKVAIDDPQQGEDRTFIQIITLENEALATSGNYRKFSINETTGEQWVHSINPKTGKAIPSNVLSVSVLAENCMKADAYATALMVMPLQQAKVLIEKQPSLEAYWILSDSLGRVKEVFSSGFLKEN